MYHRFFFALLLIFLPTQLGLHFWPDWAMVLGRRVDYLAPTIFLTDLLVFLTVGCWLASRVVQWVRGNPKSQIPISKQILKIKSQMFQTKRLWLVGVTASVVMNVFIATNPPVAMYTLVKVSELLMVGWYIVKTKPNFSLVAFCLSLGVLYSSLLAIAQFALQHSVGGAFWFLGERTFSADTPGIAHIPLSWSLRPYATFPHPNVLGGYLAATLPLITAQLLHCHIATVSKNRKEKNPRWQKIYYGLVVLFGMAALMLSFSRSAIVVGALATVATVANFKFQISNFKLLPTIFLVGFFAALLITYHLSRITPNEESVVVRQQLNAAAIKLWSSSPLFGVGLGNFLVRLPDVLPSREVYFLQPVHNIYLLVLSETGSVGLALFFLLVWRSTRKSVHSPCITFLLLGLVDHYPLTLQQGQLLFTVLLALSYTPRSSLPSSLKLSHATMAPWW